MRARGWSANTPRQSRVRRQQPGPQQGQRHWMQRQSCGTPAVSRGPRSLLRKVPRALLGDAPSPAARRVARLGDLLRPRPVHRGDVTHRPCPRWPRRPRRSLTTASSPNSCPSDCLLRPPQSLPRPRPRRCSHRRFRRVPRRPLDPQPPTFRWRPRFSPKRHCLRSETAPLLWVDPRKPQALQRPLHSHPPRPRRPPPPLRLLRTLRLRPLLRPQPQRRRPPLPRRGRWRRTSSIVPGT